MSKLTKQGLRDLNPPKEKRITYEVPVQCDHKRMKECHDKCGHWHCPDCDLSWDDGAGDKAFKEANEL